MVLPATGRLALSFAYSGSRFDGYARQPDPGLRTVEGVLLQRLRDIGAITDDKVNKWQSSSRTDQGVSARRNVVAFDSEFEPVSRLPAAIGSRLSGLYPIAATVVPDGWDPRRAARSRTYRYFVDPDRLAAQTKPTDLAAAMAPFAGTHDFTAFCRMEADRSPVRTVRAIDIIREEHLWAIEVVGETFVWNQVRRMVAAGLAVLRGEATPAELETWLGDPTQARDLDLAPPWPLVLWDIEFGDVDLTPTNAAEGRLKARLAEERYRARVASSMAEAVLDVLTEPTHNGVRAGPSIDR